MTQTKRKESGSKPLRPLLTESVTGLINFQECRRRWWLGRLYQIEPEHPRFWFGHGIHIGLAAYYNAIKTGKDTAAALTTAQTSFRQWFDRSTADLANRYGDLWQYAAGDYLGLFDAGKLMLANYVEFEAQHDFRLRPILVEKRVFLKLPPSNNVLTGQIDLLARDDTTGMLYLIDHKTAMTSASTGTALDLDEQATGYAYMLYEASPNGLLPDEFVINVLIKAAPEPPKVLQNGKLSVDKRQKTTFKTFSEAIAALDLEPDDYEEFLETLRQRGWDDFFKRESSPRNQTQVHNYEKRAIIQFEEMRDVLANPLERAYPSPSRMRCPSCPFRQVCMNMEDGGDWQYLLETNFTRIADTAWQTPPRYLEREAE